jgi:hypothetical protein
VSGVKKIVPCGTGWVMGSTAYGNTIAQFFSRIKKIESPACAGGAQQASTQGEMAINYCQN